jgi:hypothetical protein
VQYRSAIAFDNHWESLWEHCTLSGYRMPMLLDHFEMVDGHFLRGGTEPPAAESEGGPATARVSSGVATGTAFGRGTRGTSRPKEKRW